MNLQCWGSHLVLRQACRTCDAAAPRAPALPTAPASTASMIRQRTGIKLNPECAMANIFKRRRRAVPPVSHAIRTTRATNCLVKLPRIMAGPRQHRRIASLQPSCLPCAISNFFGSSLHSTCIGLNIRIGTGSFDGERRARREACSSRAWMPGTSGVTRTSTWQSGPPRGEPQRGEPLRGEPRRGGSSSGRTSAGRTSPRRTSMDAALVDDGLYGR